MEKYLKSIYCLFLLLLACSGKNGDTPVCADLYPGADGECPLVDPGIVISRADAIPGDAEKVTPIDDLAPPVLHAVDRYYGPEPMGAPIDTAGAEDSPFMSPDGMTFYFWFTPDISLGPEQ